MFSLIYKLKETGCLTESEYILLLSLKGEEAEKLHFCARETAQSIFGKNVYIRGLIEFTDYCRNDCLYCGIRKSNKNAQRYRMTENEIMQCCEKGYKLGFRTFVLQGGEDMYFTDLRLCSIVSSIKEKYPDCAITLSVGEKSRESYQKLYDAGADRYLLRHETANAKHYAKLHPAVLTLENRMECLYNLKDIGFQTGCGFMVGSPFQTMENIAEDLKFISEFKPQMTGVGPFIPHCDTEFADCKAGSAELTLNILSIIRLMHPDILLPATTALATLCGDGYQKGILAGANVVMINLSSDEAREKYKLYDNKESAEGKSGLLKLQKSLDEIGYKTIVSRGDYKK